MLNLNFSSYGPPFLILLFQPFLWHTKVCPTKLSQRPFMIGRLKPVNLIKVFAFKVLTYIHPPLFFPNFLVNKIRFSKLPQKWAMFSITLASNSQPLFIIPSVRKRACPVAVYIMDQRFICLPPLVQQFKKYAAYR